MKNIVSEAERFVTGLLSEKLDPGYVFHSLKHTQRTVKAAQEIATAEGLNEDDIEVVTLAAWFHDSGFIETCKGHEEIGGQLADKFLSGHKYPPEKTEQVKACILSTKIETNPVNRLQEVLRDADLIHLGKKSFKKRNSELRRELQTMLNKSFSDRQWLELDIKFFDEHPFYTSYAKNRYGERRHANYAQLQDEFKHINGGELQSMKNKLKPKKEKVAGRGVETMFRLTSKNHFTLSSIADNKASTLISISSLIISIILSVLLRKLSEQPELTIPTVMLLLTLLGTIIFAVISTRPKVTSIQISKSDVEQKKGNLLFFGNFINMSVDDYEWSMEQLMADQDYLYKNLTRDIYYLGVVLGRKYRYLRIAYNIFMYGLIISVLSFIAATAF